MKQQHAIVAGAGGVIGRYLTGYFADRPEWAVTALSRRPLRYVTTAEWLRVDLANPADCRENMASLSDATHLFFAAYQETGSTVADLVAPNLALLKNTVEALEAAAPGLQRIVLFTGGKAYGSHLGPYKTPAKETDPRHLPPNFYYDQEDYLAERQRGKSWTWTVLRPTNICGLATGNPMNISTLIAVYAAICKELGLPLRFPGKESVYDKLTQFTDSSHLSRATHWVVEETQCENQLFNLHNGDHVRWKYLWPVFADYFGMKLAEPQRIPLSLFMADKEPLWRAIAEKYGLAPIPFGELVSWGFGDFLFNTFEWDLMTDMTKIRKAGFCGVVDTEEMYLRLFDDFRAARLVP